MVTPEGTFGREQWRAAYFNHFRPILMEHRRKHGVPDTEKMVIVTDGLDAHVMCLDVLDDMRAADILLYALPSHMTRWDCVLVCYDNDVERW
jgi:hypothetical protein